MRNAFDAAFFVGNRARLREMFTGTAPIILTAHSLMQQSADMAFPFRQDTSFWYLTGIDEPDVILVMDKGEEYLILPERDEVRQAFDGSISDELLADISGVAQIFDQKEGWRRLGSRLKKVGHVATLAAPLPHIAGYEFYTNPARRNLIKRLQATNGNIELLDLREHLIRMRMIKQPLELAAIETAVDLTVKTFNRIHKKLSSYTTEFEIAAELGYCYQREAADHAYAPIVAGGLNAVTLHYVRNADTLNKNDLLLIDSGASVQHYAADITRTYSLGEPTKRQQAVLEAVAEASEYAKQLLKPGVVLKDYEATMALFMSEKIRELGLPLGTEKNAIREYYPHSTSHFLGLDVHDVGDYDAPLEIDSVLTVEPGIYIAAEGIGVRIEDDIVITADGNRVLSKKLAAW